MSMEARNYVRQLQYAPCSCECALHTGGKPRHGTHRVTVQERAVLRCLADYHNRTEGCCWPSVRTIALESGLSDRRVREILAALECRGIIQRGRRFRDDGSQTSNRYFFPELGSSPSNATALLTDKHSAVHSSGGEKRGTWSLLSVAIGPVVHRGT